MADTALEDFLDAPDAAGDPEPELDEISQEFVAKLVTKLLIVCDQVAGAPLYRYQRPLAARILESLIINDGADITALASRQSGKSQTLSATLATAMIMLPILALIYPDLLGKYRTGVWVGAFAPVELQAETLYNRITGMLNSDGAQEIMADPEINVKISGKGRTTSLSNGSLVRKTTCHPRATIESTTYHVLLIDEAQGAESRVIRKSVKPMGASTNATTVMTGTPTYEKNVFYRAIQDNKRAITKRGRRRKNHLEWDWKEAAKENPNYERYVQKEILVLGEDSDEFKLSYCNMWLLDKGMFTSSSKFERLGDVSMQKLVYNYTLTPVVVGIDCARKQDRTVVTVVYVDWDHPDQFGLYHHRVLAWLDLEGLDWEAQYHRIVEFLSGYKVWKIGIDCGGLGDVVAQRLRILLPHIEIVDLAPDQGAQSQRWKHLRNLLDREQIAWPAGSKVRQRKVFKRFEREMLDLELLFKGPYVLAEAPRETDAHDDYPDSLAMACVLTLEQAAESNVEESVNVFYSGKR